ncbi:DUF998 domain-containing protein [Nocardia sp. NRRL S-836]|uniref:DUF998 domain-containing protein n=1 Tax=Nocardia sp. NRRL S-836 TaxID=1519492 RepID=UPI0006ADE2EE|nr:DUF998 domain-containing protein [Nocardia sp. NRRL S-836]KOV90070.1 hypothetical protein ADL03_01630 [Nocardia sp. NRRL S-836]
MTPVPQKPADRTAAWLITAAVLYSCWLLELVLPTGLSVFDSYVSELLADDQPFRWIFRTTDTLAACCLLLAARGLRRWLPAPPGARLGSRLADRLVVVAVVVFAVATLANTALSLDCAASADALCRHREEIGAVSLGHRLHQVTSLLTFGGALVAFACLERRTPRWDAGVVVVLLTATGVLSAVLADQPGAGLVQRAQLLTIAAGLVLLARSRRRVR